MANVAIVTLGCRANQADAEGLAELLRQRGWQVLAGEPEAWGGDPDVIVINSCAVTGRAEAKSRQAARHAMRTHPGSLVVLAGCYPQVALEQARGIAGLAGLAGTGRVETAGMLESLVAARGLGELREQAADRTGDADGTRPGEGAPPEAGLGLPACFEDLPLRPRPGRVRAFLKVQEGCEMGCAYCVVPLARGRQRSLPAEGVVAKARALVEAGAKEIVLTGIHLGAYGRDLGGESSLAGIVRECLRVPGLLRLRLSSLEPTDLDPELLELMAAEPRFCHHLHIPLQSGSDAVLGRMGRRYSAAGYREVVGRARAVVPDLALSTDLLVGFPGESEAESEETVTLVREVGFMRLHVFAYSARPGTRAVAMEGQIAVAERERRAARLIEVGRELALRFHQGLVGRTEEVLVERALRRGGTEGDGYWSEGLISRYVRLRVRSGRPVAVGELVPTRLERAGTEGMTGRLLSQRCNSGGAVCR